MESVKDGEERWHAIGMIEGKSRILVEIDTYQAEAAEELIHIILLAVYASTLREKAVRGKPFMKKAAKGNRWSWAVAR